ncbi:MAG: archaeal proteasome endopeptidase complex subunit beta [Candidatus Aenigmarchaeota archaeon]|nr:archaeal proteasome endopeptidase complex subunit beta [Candidatus Aenigmarchaeota archaeon]MDW8160261.1 archaeal proteasome endopeptidase complex subunit beta [Candidatus Aenigmarchaeota archaeon]
MSEKSLEIKKTGTTTVGILCKNAVILAAEKKSTLGYLVASKETDKIIPLDDHIAMTTAGASGDAQILARYLKAEFKLYETMHKKKISVKGAATLLSNILQSSKYFPYYVQLIIAGVDDKGPSIYSLDLIGGMEEEKKFTSTGSGSPIALGVLEDQYREDMTIEEAKELAKRAIKAAVERDIGSGGKSIDIVVITKNGIEKSVEKF